MPTLAPLIATPTPLVVPRPTSTPVPDEEAPEKPLLDEEDWPSFDCTQAETDREVFLCTDWSSAKAEREFAEFWKEYLPTWDGHLLRERVINAHQHWSTRDGCRFNDRYSDLRDCLVSRYRNRQNQLEHFALRQLDASNYDAAWGPDRGSVHAERRPAPDGYDFEAGAIRPLLEAIEFELALDLSASTEAPRSVRISLKVEHGERLSLVSDTTTHRSMGAAHDSTWFREYLFDRAAERYIPLSDLLDPDQLDAATADVREALFAVAGRAPSQMEDYDLERFGLRPQFAPDGLITSFETYSVATSFGGYAGRVCFYGMTISSDVLAPYANDEYRPLFAENPEPPTNDVDECLNQ